MLMDRLSRLGGAFVVFERQLDSRRMGFSWYVANFGRYDKTYGALGGVVGFMTWIWLSVMVVLFGA